MVLQAHIEIYRNHHTGLRSLLHYFRYPLEVFGIALGRATFISSILAQKLALS